MAYTAKNAAGTDTTFKSGSESAEHVPFHVVAQRSDALYSGETLLTPKFIKIDAATSGNNTIVAAVGGKKIRVLSGHLIVSAAVTVRWESGADGTALTGQYQFSAAGQGMNYPEAKLGHFESASGVLLNLELSGAVSVDGAITYVEV